jgi:integrase
MPNFTVRTPNARRLIPAGSKQHIAPLPAPGLALTYRKSESLGGVWFGRKLREGTKQYLFHRIGLADDVQPANGINVFSYEQAVKEAENWNAQETGLVVVNKAYSVRNLMNDYLADRETKKGRSQIRKKQMAEKNILLELGNIPLRKLTHQQVENWLHNRARSLPRTRSGPNELVYREVANVEDEEYRRKRKASANTMWNLLKAALNYGYKTGKVSNRSAWDKIESFKLVNEPKVVDITFDQLVALIEACEPEFQLLAKAALYTGARVSELHRMQVKEFNSRTSKVYLPKTKNGNPRYVFLNGEALELFLEVTKGRAPDDVIFTKDGEPWKEGSQQYPMYYACDAAGVTRKFTIHQLRHQCAVICLEGGMRMEEVSRMLGHKNIEITQKFYARFSRDHMQDKVEQYAPRLRPVAPPSAPVNAAKVIAFRKAANG